MQCGKCGYNPHSPLAPWFTFNNNQSYSNHCTQKMFSSNLKNFGFYSRPPNTAPPFTGSPPPILPPIFKSRIGFFLVIYDSFHHQFPNTTAFSSVPRAAVLGGTKLYQINQIIYQVCKQRKRPRLV